MVASTPIGDKTQIDEAIVDKAKALKRLSSSGARKSVNILASAKPGFMRPFIESIQELDRLHNEPVALALGDSSLYVLPLGEDQLSAQENLALLGLESNQQQEDLV